MVIKIKLCIYSYFLRINSENCWLKEYISRPLIQIAMIFLKLNDDPCVLKPSCDPHAT